MSSCPNPAKTLANSQRGLLSSLWRTFGPQQNARLSEKLAIYACFFFILTTLVLIAAYVSVKTVGRFLGARIRNNCNAERERLIAQVKATDKRAVIVGFFHPYCDAGGGGERVLWTAVEATLRHANIVCAIYTGDTVTKQEIISKVDQRFQIKLDPTRIAIVYLARRPLVDSSTYPCLTLLGQAAGSVVLGYEAVTKLAPDVFIDTMGYAFTFPLVSVLLSIPVAAYVHYPMISTDMFSTLSLLQAPKYVYWRVFALLYAAAGAFADVVVTNSTWTYTHIRNVWWLNRLLALASDSSRKLDFQIMYPPCSTSELDFPLTQRQPVVLAIAQFRPEKRHDVIIKQFAAYVSTYRAADVSLVLVGSVRDDRDRHRVAELRTLAQSLDIADRVEFVLEAKWDVVKHYLRTSSVGVNAMWNEHFGIGVVEYMAAGLIPVVHDSGGPKLDIVVAVDGKPSGFHFTTDGVQATSLASVLDIVFKLSASEQLQYRERARRAAERFSVERFEDAWSERLRVLLMLEQYRRVDRLSRGLPS